ncbi:MAG: type II secretion system protein [Candidatus Latescibacteria bacterium]|nr:type II secretion system protein [Candidatus Latescibacterota bacterium]
MHCDNGKQKGFTLIELLAAILIVAILIALSAPHYSLFQERARRVSVKNNMYIVQSVLESYAVDHYGNYPTDGLSWDPDDESGICSYFPGGNPIANQENQIMAGRFPINPYTGRRYNDSDIGKIDLDYTETHYGAFDFKGQSAIIRGSEDDCYYLDLGEGDFAGGISIATWLNETINDVPVEYGIFGYGREFTYPMYDLDITADEIDNPEYWTFFVLHN